MQNIDNFVADLLLSIKAIKFQPHNPFVWANGWNSPIYCDNNKINSSPRLRDIIKLELATTIAENFPECEVIAGVAPNAIAMGVLVADELGIPFVFVHHHPKDHGLENMIEGDLKIRKKVVVIDDQVNVGIHTMTAINAVKKSGCKVQGLVSIFDFELNEAQERFATADVKYIPLCTLSTVLQHAEQINYIDKDAVKVIKQWQKSPANWK
mgnify:CR=1 FL=1